MISSLGTALILLGLCCATFGSVVGIWGGMRSSREAWGLARRAALSFAALMIAANLLMVYALLTHDFTVNYVAEVGSITTPVYFTVVSLWASLNGSILFWGGILGIYLAVFLIVNGHHYREYMPYTIGVAMGISVFFALLIATVANPFAATPDHDIAQMCARFGCVDGVPTDGPGPNPLLQNHWLMAIHPPMLYLGFVGMTLPFSMLSASLMAGRLDAGWMVPIRRWMLIPWTFLTVGIVLGGWWSYAVLGWGGAWAWDPVENASFHPWLTGTAFLHSAMVFQRRGTLRVWTIVLGMSTFLMTLIGTFMTRSGVFNSVHSFTQSDIGPFFLVFIAIVLVFSVVLIAVREHSLALPEEDHRAQTTLMSTMYGAKLHGLSREAALMLQNVVFVVFTFTVLLGTLYPLITEAVEDRRVSVGEPYFDYFALPLGLLLVFLMGIGPALPWGRMAPDRAVRRFAIPCVVGAMFAGFFVIVGFQKPGTVLAMFLIGFAFWANFGEFLTPTLARTRRREESILLAASRVFRRSRRRFGGHIAHFGVLLAVFSLALSKGYKVERDVTMRPDQNVVVNDYLITFIGADFVEQEHRDSVIARFNVSSNGRDLGEYRPRMNYYPGQREPIYTPEVHSTLTGDLYLSVIELERDGSHVIVRIITMPAVIWLWIAPLVIALGSIITIWPARRQPRSQPQPNSTVTRPS